MKAFILFMLLNLSIYAKDYTATVISAYDGDTATVIIDLGLKVSVEKRLRFYGIDTPEMTGSEKVEGKKVRDFVRSLILGKKITVRTIEDKKGREETGKFGRLLAILLVEINGKQVNLNELLLKKGYAVAYKEK